jgi:hypothetical protein
MPETRPTPDPTPDGSPAQPARGSHRGRRKPSSIAVPILLAAALAAAGFIVVWVWLGASPGADDPGSPTAVADPATTSAQPSVSPSPSGSTSTSARVTPSPEPSEKPTRSEKPKPTKTQQPEPARDVPVVVFNQTSVGGLAAGFAAELEAAGWDVVGVDNWVGTVPATTVYYWPGDESAARDLRADFPAVGRIHPAVSNMPSSTLTVVLTTDFPTG